MADIDGDGKDDLVRASQTTINVYLSHGDGTFILVSSAFANVANKNTAIAFADFDGDSRLDAAISFPDRAVALTGNGDGMLTTRPTSNLKGMRCRQPEFCC